MLEAAQFFARKQVGPIYARGDKRNLASGGYRWDGGSAIHVDWAGVGEGPIPRLGKAGGEAVSASSPPGPSAGGGEFPASPSL